MTDTYEKCSCGSRQRAKCVKDYKSEQTVLDANVAYEMIENPPEPNEKLLELLRSKQ